MPVKPKKELTGADAAIAEVTSHPIKVEFRGQEFEIPIAAFASPSIGLAYASGRFNEITYALLAASGPSAPRRFLALCESDDTMVSVAVEFLEAVSAVAGQGNSSASSDS